MKWANRVSMNEVFEVCAFHSDLASSLNHFFSCNSLLYQEHQQGEILLDIEFQSIPAAQRGSLNDQ
jgi:hypothetical protein